MNKNMKTSILKYLPMAAALTLATACSNDEDNNIVPQPLLDAETTQPAVVKVPFSVKVDNGKQSLKKIKYEEKNTDDGQIMTFEFEDKDVEETKYILALNEIIPKDPDYKQFFSKDKQQYLTLIKNDDNDFVFDGELSLNEGMEESFANGDCKFEAFLMPLEGLEGMVFGSDILQFTSLERSLDLVSTFKSDAKTINLETSNDYAYLYVDGVSDGFSLTLNDDLIFGTLSDISLNDGNWFSIYIGDIEDEETPELESSLWEGSKTIQPGHLYYYDLAPKVKPTPEPIPTPVVPRG